MRWILAGVGVLMILIGAIWTLQGVGILLGSPMTGQSFWAIMGLLLLVVGIVLCVFGLRRKPSAPPL